MEKDIGKILTVFSTQQDPNYDCMGHSWRRSSGPFHRLASDFGLCPLHQRQIQEGRVVALRLVSGNGRNKRGVTACDE